MAWKEASKLRILDLWRPCAGNIAVQGKITDYPVRISERKVSGTSLPAWLEGRSRRTGIARAGSKEPRILWVAVRKYVGIDAPGAPSHLCCDIVRQAFYTYSHCWFRMSAASGRLQSSQQSRRT